MEIATHDRPARRRSRAAWQAGRALCQDFYGPQHLNSVNCGQKHFVPNVHLLISVYHCTDMLILRLKVKKFGFCTQKKCKTRAAWARGLSGSAWAGTFFTHQKFIF